MKAMKERMETKSITEEHSSKDVAILIVKLILSVIITICILAGAAIINIMLHNRPEIANGTIKRPYTQVLMCLNEEPADISSERYETFIPHTVQKDIEKMLESNGELDVLYYAADRSSYIRITKSQESSTGIKFIVGEDYLHYEAEMAENISMYKSGRNIIIYGSESASRILNRCQIAVECEPTAEPVDYVSLENRYMDLYGTDISYDEIRGWNSEMTLVKNGNNFMFYRLGNQVGEIVVFPGEKITEFNHYYILDDKHDMYYLYYSDNLTNPWIKFVKVDSNVSDVTDDFIKMPFGEYGNIQYPIYMKNGEKYVAVSNGDTEKAYGQNYGRKYNILKGSTFDFDIATMKLTGDNVFSITLNRRLVQSYPYEEYDWYVRYNYIAKGQTLYFEERINGLDSYLTTIIPEEEMKKFEEREISLEELEEVVEELKQLYNKFATQKSPN